MKVENEYLKEKRKTLAQLLTAKDKELNALILSNYNNVNSSITLNNENPLPQPSSTKTVIEPLTTNNLSHPGLLSSGSTFLTDQTQDVIANINSDIEYNVKTNNRFEMLEETEIEQRAKVVSAKVEEALPKITDDNYEIQNVTIWAKGF